MLTRRLLLAGLSASLSLLALPREKRHVYIVVGVLYRQGGISITQWCPLEGGSVIQGQDSHFSPWVTFYPTEHDLRQAWRYLPKTARVSRYRLIGDHPVSRGEEGYWSGSALDSDFRVA